MKRVWKVVKWLLIIGACLFLIAQLKRPARTNPASDQSLALEVHLQVDPKVASILERSCVDCHSHKTRWPWYSNVAPVSWFLVDHVDHGRSHLNFSEWGKLDARRQSKKLDEICDLSKAGEMPLSSYTPLHPGSKLTAEDATTICEWTEREQSRLSLR